MTTEELNEILRKEGKLASVQGPFGAYEKTSSGQQPHILINVSLKPDRIRLPSRYVRAIDSTARKAEDTDR